MTATERGAPSLKNMIKLFSRVDLEASFTRVQQHTQNRSIGLISASPDNLACLKNDVRKAGSGFIEARNVDETLLLVIGKMRDDGGQLLGHLKHLGEKYGQDWILHKPHNSEKVSLHETGIPGKGEHIEIGSWHPNKIQEFHSFIKNRKPTAVVEQFHFINAKSFFSRLEKIVLAEGRRLSSFARLTVLVRCLLRSGSHGC
jgi:hypothetical protein